MACQSCLNTYSCQDGYVREPEVSQAIKSNNKKQELPMCGYFYYLLHSPPKNMSLRTRTWGEVAEHLLSLHASSWLVSLEKEFWRLGCLCWVAHGCPLGQWPRKPRIQLCLSTMVRRVDVKRQHLLTTVFTHWHAIVTDVNWDRRGEKDRVNSPGTQQMKTEWKGVEDLRKSF